MRSLQESQWRSKRAQKNYKFTANSKRKFPTNETENCFISANLLKIQNHSKNYCIYLKNWSVYRTRSYSCNVCNYSLLFFICNLRQGIGIINLLCWFITTHGTACERKITKFCWFFIYFCTHMGLFLLQRISNTIVLLITCLTFFVVISTCYMIFFMIEAFTILMEIWLLNGVQK